MVTSTLYRADMNRRTAMTAIGAAALSAAARAQLPLPPPKEKRSSPLICVYSGNLARVPYAMLGDIAGQIGYEGVDLTVLPGGHVNPYIANVDMVRAVEAVRSSNLELPMISTQLTAATNPTAYAVLALANQGAVPMFRTGYWPLESSLGLQQRLAEVRRDIAGLTMLGRRCNMEALIPNRAGAWAGHNIMQAQFLVGELDRQSAGYYFDVAACVADAGPDNWPSALRAALPRTKAVAIWDFKLKKPDPSGIEPCSLGEGSVDWAQAFAILAESRFAGPVSIHMEYTSKDNVSAARNDLEFVRKQIQQAYAAAQKS